MIIGWRSGIDRVAFAACRIGEDGAASSPPLEFGPFRRTPKKLEGEDDFTLGFLQFLESHELKI